MLPGAGIAPFAHVDVHPMLRNIVFGLLICGAFHCGGSSSALPPLSINRGSTLSFAASAVEATRFPSTCGVQNPPFKSDDLYSVLATGSKGAGLQFTFFPGVSVGQPQALDVIPYSPAFGPSAVLLVGAVQSAQTANRLMFQLTWGSDLGEIDSNPFDQVTVTFRAFPTRDGDPLTIEFRIHFVDDQVLDATISADLVSSRGSCPAG